MLSDEIKKALAAGESLISAVSRLVPGADEKEYEYWRKTMANSQRPKSAKRPPAKRPSRPSKKSRFNSSAAIGRSMAEMVARVNNKEEGNDNDKR